MTYRVGHRAYTRLPWWFSDKESTCNAGDAGRFDPWVGKIPWEKEMATHSSILGVSNQPTLRNPIDRGTWWVTVHGVTKAKVHMT